MHIWTVNYYRKVGPRANEYSAEEQEDDGVEQVCVRASHLHSKSLNLQPLSSCAWTAS